MRWLRMVRLRVRSLFLRTALERELEVVAAEQGEKKLLRQSLHLLLDQFAR